MTTIRNFTPHEVKIVDTEGNVLKAFSSEGCARCSQSETIIANIDGVDVTKQTFGNVEGLPEPQNDTYYIVSRLVASALPDRKDLLIPGPTVREGSTIKGCLSLSAL